ncbi:OLC1v1028157C1 [Oldenlandia corymbosa var. corymbosa]|uniref:OLC1v1028157C1 n=1 Tax=Oldenlandia corymbosa var. corymbosa TaxID=529605 RepID=A0AAV1CD37_OLDCO|nr:OLC1v1028157C1 [Oldenlandia corymbosa var. corymbosa]
MAADASTISTFGELYPVLKQDMIELINLVDGLETEQNRAVLNQAAINDLTQRIAEGKRRYKPAHQKDLTKVMHAAMGYMAEDVGDLRALVMLRRESYFTKTIFYNAHGPNAAAIIAAANQYNQRIQVFRGAVSVSEEEHDWNQEKIKEDSYQEPDTWHLRKW